MFWDALDATGAPPCPVVGASLGGMIAAELAAMRPEIVTSLTLLAPFGINDGRQRPASTCTPSRAAERIAHLFAKGVPDAFADRFAHKGEEEAPVARYLSDIAAASLLWPLGDRGRGASGCTASRCPKLVLWGDQDELLVPGLIERWGGGERDRRRRPPARMGHTRRGCGTLAASPRRALSEHAERAATRSTTEDP